jgi:hypothetical protein
MWVLHHRGVPHHLQIWASQEEILLDPNANVFRSLYVTFNPIRVLRLSYLLIAVSDYRAKSVKVRE